MDKKAPFQELWKKAWGEAWGEGVSHRPNPSANVMGNEVQTLTSLALALGLEDELLCGRETMSNGTASSPLLEDVIDKAKEAWAWTLQQDAPDNYEETKWLAEESRAIIQRAMKEKELFHGITPVPADISPFFEMYGGVKITWKHRSPLILIPLRLISEDGDEAGEEAKTVKYKSLAVVDEERMCVCLTFTATGKRKGNSQEADSKDETAQDELVKADFRGYLRLPKRALAGFIAAAALNHAPNEKTFVRIAAQLAHRYYTPLGSPNRDVWEAVRDVILGNVPVHSETKGEIVRNERPTPWEYARVVLASEIGTDFVAGGSCYVRIHRPRLPRLYASKAYDIFSALREADEKDTAEITAAVLQSVKDFTGLIKEGCWRDGYDAILAVMLEKLRAFHDAHPYPQDALYDGFLAEYVIVGGMAKIMGEWTQNYADDVPADKVKTSHIEREAIAKVLDYTESMFGLGNFIISGNILHELLPLYAVGKLPIFLYGAFLGSYYVL